MTSDGVAPDSEPDEKVIDRVIGFPVTVWLWRLRRAEKRAIVGRGARQAVTAAVAALIHLRCHGRRIVNAGVTRSRRAAAGISRGGRRVARGTLRLGARAWRVARSAPRSGYRAVRRMFLPFTCLKASLWMMLLAAAVRLPLAFADHEILPGDSEEFMEMAHDLASGNGFGDPVRNPAYRAPGFPVFAAGLEVLPGRREDVIVVAQLILGCLLVGLVLAVTWRLFGRGAALVAGLLLAITPAMPALEFVLLSDFLFAFLCFGGAALLAIELQNRAGPRIWVLLAVGAIFGLATLTRPVGQFLLPVPGVALVIGGFGWKRALAGGLVSAAALAAVVAPWIVRNAIVVDRAAISSVSGDTLFARAFEVDKLPIPEDTALGRFTAEAVAARGRQRPVAAVRAAFEARGVSRLGALRAEEEVAQTAIRRAPGRYAVGTVREVWKLRFRPEAVTNRSDVGPHIVDVPEPTASVWEVTRPASAVWSLLSISTLAGLFTLLSRNPGVRTAGACFVLVWFAAAVGTAAGRGALTRYALEFAPLAAVVGSVGATLVAQRVWRGLRSPRLLAPLRALSGRI